MLLNAIKKTNDNNRISDKLHNKTLLDESHIDFPIASYLYVISNFINRGYYKERELVYLKQNKGKIQWNRTIKNIKPYIQANKAVYLNFIIRKPSLSENTLITQIHEFCVYESFSKLGWLYTSKLPKKPQIKFNKQLFLKVLSKKHTNTFIDENKQLFYHLIQIVNSISNSLDSKNYTFGTNRFEYVWEYMTDNVFGRGFMHKCG